MSAVRLRGILGHGHGALSIEVGGRSVGRLRYRVVDGGALGRVTLQSIHVAPEERGQGFGAAALAALVQRLRIPAVSADRAVALGLGRDPCPPLGAILWASAGLAAALKAIGGQVENGIAYPPKSIDGG